MNGPVKRRVDNQEQTRIKTNSALRDASDMIQQ